MNKSNDKQNLKKKWIEYLRWNTPNRQYKKWSSLNNAGKPANDRNEWYINWSVHPEFKLIVGEQSVKDVVNNGENNYCKYSFYRITLFIYIFIY